MLANHPIMAFVGVTDASRTRAFYGGLLGLPLVSEDGFALVFKASNASIRAAFVQKVVPAPYTALGWDVPDIVATVDRMREAGVQFERYPYFEQDERGIWTAPGGAARVAWFKDPDGNLLSVAQHG